MLKKTVLALLFIAGLAIRLYRLNAPLADWHSFRQADTASVSREFINHGYNLFKPKYHDLSNIQSGQPNPEGYRMVEFPLFNTLHAGFFQTIRGISLLNFEGAGRMISILASLGAGFFLYLIVSRETNFLTGILSAGFLLFLPFSIYYSRTILPDYLMVFLSLASIYFLQDKLFISLVLGALSILVKPYAIFLLTPAYLVMEVNEFNIKHLLRVACYLLLVALPFITWRLWIKQFPEGIPASQWLLNYEGIRLRPAWWRWLFGERIGRLILGSWGLIPFGLGLIYQVKKKINYLFFSWLVGIFVYFVIFAWGNVQHDYYQISVIPVIAVFLAKGYYFLVYPSQKINKFLSRMLLVTCCVLQLSFSWYHIREYYKINHPEIVAAGQKADQLLPENAKVIAPYQGDTAFLYQTNRNGWPAVTRPLHELVDMGAEYYVSVNFDQTTAEVKTKCKVIEESEDWIIINLKQCPDAPM